MRPQKLRRPPTLLLFTRSYSSSKLNAVDQKLIDWSPVSNLLVPLAREIHSESRIILMHDQGLTTALTYAALQ